MTPIIDQASKNKLMLTGAVIILCFIGMAVLAPVLAPYDPNYVQLENRLLTPGVHHLLGTDGFGRDILSRVIYGARVSLTLSIVVVTLNLVVGMLIGAVAGYCGGLIDEAIMRLVDILMAFPGIIFALCIIGILGASIPNLIFALVALGWVGYARIARGLVLSIKEQVYISATRALGGGRIYILLRHIVPNIFPPLMVLATLHTGHTILSIAGLSFLGLGVQAPTPEWGAMLSEGKQFMSLYPHIMIFPGLAVAFAVFGFNLFGDGLRDALDPKTRKIVQT